MNEFFWTPNAFTCGGTQHVQHVCLFIIEFDWYIILWKKILRLQSFYLHVQFSKWIWNTSKWWINLHISMWMNTNVFSTLWKWTRCYFFWIFFFPSAILFNITKQWCVCVCDHIAPHHITSRSCIHFIDIENSLYPRYFHCMFT